MLSNNVSKRFDPAAGVQETPRTTEVIPNAAEEEFRRIGLADFYLAGGMSEGDILAHLADHLNELWGGPCPVSATLRERGLRLFRGATDKRLRGHEAELRRIEHEVD
ncbi:hypothetical protein PHYC_03423 [Phycisphaerales bacterium]|nr:hypothetical protein PHYC_03423 [Phycisphaerales bacterium]